MSRFASSQYKSNINFLELSAEDEFGRYLRFGEVRESFAEIIIKLII